MVQNLENKRFNLRLRAKSLSLQELRAKSREHGSYACPRRGLRSVLGLDIGGGEPQIARLFRLWRLGSSPAGTFDSAQGRLTRRPSSIKRPVRLSKIDYLVDNVASRMLSGLGHSVNDKACCGTEGSCLFLTVFPRNQIEKKRKRKKNPATETC